MFYILENEQNQSQSPLEKVNVFQKNLTVLFELKKRRHKTPDMPGGIDASVESAKLKLRVRDTMGKYQMFDTQCFHKKKQAFLPEFRFSEISRRFSTGSRCDYPTF